jgi:uncharacterized protein
MVFRRRNPLSFAQRLRHLFFPPGGWRRSLVYLRLRLTRIPDAPKRVARGIACGVFVGCTPFFGLHLPLAAGLAWVFRGNIVAAMIATAAGNPVTIPILAVVSLDLGRTILGTGDGAAFSQIMTEFGHAGDQIGENLRAIFTRQTMHWDQLWGFLHQVFLPYLVGSLGPAAVTAGLGYWLSLPALEAFHRRRLARRQFAPAASQSDEKRRPNA